MNTSVTKNGLMTALGWTLLIVGTALMVIAVFGLYGCGDDAQAAPNEQFLGDWTTEGGGGAFYCDDGEAGGVTANPGYIITLLPGVEDTNFSVDVAPECILDGYVVTHGVGSNPLSSHCDYVRQDPTWGRINIHITQQAGTEFTVTEDKAAKLNRLEEDGVRVYDFSYLDYPGGYTLSCTMTYNITYTQPWND